MRRIGWLVMVASLSLSLTALANEKSTNTQTPATGMKSRGSKMVVPSPRALNARIAELKQEQQTAVKELDEIKKLAAEEKATKTVAALDKLIALRNQEFQKQLAPLEQQLKNLEAAQKKPGSALPKDTKTAPKKSGS